MEERKHKRVQLARTINIKTQSNQNLKLEVQDYSMGGMGLVGSATFDLGDILELQSIITPDGGERVLELKGEVVHGENQFQEYAFGVCFL